MLYDVWCRNTSRDSKNKLQSEHRSFPEMFDRADSVVIKRGRTDRFPQMRLNLDHKQEPFLHKVGTQKTRQRNQSWTSSLKCDLIDWWILWRHFFIRSHTTRYVSCFFMLFSMTFITAHTTVWPQSEIQWGNDPSFFVKLLGSILYSRLSSSPVLLRLSWPVSHAPFSLVCIGVRFSVQSLMSRLFCLPVPAANFE